MHFNKRRCHQADFNLPLQIKPSRSTTLGTRRHAATGSNTLGLLLFVVCFWTKRRMNALLKDINPQQSLGCRIPSWTLGQFGLCIKNKLKRVVAHGVTGKRSSKFLPWRNAGRCI